MQAADYLKEIDQKQLESEELYLKQLIEKKRIIIEKKMRDTTFNAFAQPRDISLVEVDLT